MRRPIDPISILTCLACALALALASPVVLAEGGGETGTAGEGAARGADPGADADADPAGAATAADPAADRRAQIRAARDAALEALRHEVLSAPVGRELTVADVVDAAAREAEGVERGEDLLEPALSAAEQVGSPRPIGKEWGYEVRMQVDGGEVAAVLLSVTDEDADALGEALEVAAEELKEQVEDLGGRTFIGRGVSMGDIRHVRPPEDLASWRRVNDENREKALDNARHDAAERVLDSVRSVELGEGKSVGDVLELAEVRDALAGWLRRRPVTSVEFREDLEVRVGISAPADEFWEVFEGTLANRNDVPFPQEAASREEVRREIERRLEPTIGRARAKPGRRRDGEPAPEGGVAQGVPMPAEAPEWAEEQLAAEGTGSDVESDLKAKRQAEMAARQKLREGLEDLPLSPRTRLGDAARKDPRVGEALDRGVERATVSKVEYDTGGEVVVRLVLDLDELWRELESEARDE